MTEALNHCRETYTDLATIESEEDVKLLNNMADLSKFIFSELVPIKQPAWIGLHHDEGRWRWSLSDTSFYKQGETDFRNWNDGEPNGPNGEHCGQMYHTGKWNDKTCTLPIYSVCSNVTGPKVTFVLNPTAMSWTDAQSYCRKHHTDLASVRNMEENLKVKELIPFGQGAWFGLFRDFWQWLDGSKSSFRHWSKWEPNNDFQTEACVAADFSDSGKWENGNCDFKRAFICYSIPSIQVIIVRLVKQSSSLDLNDPAVMENISKQLRLKLKDQGVTEDVTLSWRKQSDGKVFHKEEKEREGEFVCFHESSSLS
uniref:C-type mannose receptor 2-like n=1 Tax=Semicossyphus pulcher TaxID=241346 RepID=UPI0037E8F325